mgnify:CR=1 FL=1
MERDREFRNRWVHGLRKYNCVCSTHVMVRLRVNLFLELSVSAPGRDNPPIFLTHSHHGNILYEISGSPLNLNPSLIMVVKDLPCFLSVVGYCLLAFQACHHCYHACHISYLELGQSSDWIDVIFQALLAPIETTRETTWGWRAGKMKQGREERKCLYFHIPPPKRPQQGGPHIQTTNENRGNNHTN